MMNSTTYANQTLSNDTANTTISQENDSSIPPYLLNEKSNNTCIICLIQNEQSIKLKLNNGKMMANAQTKNYEAFCVLGD